jgi:hypothetical protein
MDHGMLRLRVETDAGPFLRQIPGPAPLAPGDVGPAAEESTSGTAMTWGLPDFVFDSAVRSRGRGTRELGDVIVCVGALAAVVQVKARHEATDDPDRERSWLDKKIQKAAGQAKGTLRALDTAVTTTLINRRGAKVEITYADKSWVPVVIIDHPRPEGCIPAADAGAVVLWRRDWEFLFFQLKSTHAVIQYLHRISQLDPVPLGEEPHRYYALAAADAATPAAEMDTTGLVGTPQISSVPLLPQPPAGTDGLLYHGFLHQVLVDLAECPRPDGFGEGEFLDVIAAVDMLPVGYRTELGQILWERLQRARRLPPGQARWDVRRYLAAGSPHFLFVVAPAFSPEVQTMFSPMVQLRHQQLIEARSDMDDVTSVGIMLTPRFDGRRLWDTWLTAVTGDQDIDSESRAELERIWPASRAGNPATTAVNAAAETETNAATETEASSAADAPAARPAPEAAP